MHKDLKFDSNQKVQFNIKKNRKKVPAKILSINNDSVQLILPVRARAVVKLRVKAEISNLQLTILNSTPDKDNSDRA